MAMMPMPANDRKVPTQPALEKRSPRNGTAMMAVRIGATLMMKLAAPDEIVCSPMLSSAV